MKKRNKFPIDRVIMLTSALLFATVGVRVPQDSWINYTCLIGFIINLCYLIGTGINTLNDT